MRPFVLIVLSVCLHYLSVAQTDITYYNHDWKEVTDISLARFYSEKTKTDSGWRQRDYYLPSMQLQMVGLYADKASTIKNGRFIWYYADGTPKTAAAYKNNKLNGLHLAFHPNGSLSDSSVYKNGNLVGYGLGYFSDGMMSDSTIARNDSVSVAHYWHSNGQPSAGGIFINGKRDGIWNYYNTDGKLASKIEYKDNKPLAEQYFDANGGIIPKPEDAEVEPKFNKKYKDFKSYLEKFLYWPSDYTLKNVSAVVVVVEFTVDEFGQVRDVHASVPFHPAFDRIALDLVRKSPKWIPARQFNRYVLSYHKQAINFALSQGE